MTILFTANHKVDDVVYVVSDCIRRGLIKQVDFTQQDSATIPFLLSYEVLYDGYVINTTVNSAVDFNVPGAGSPLQLGSPVTGSPLANVVGSPLPLGVGSPLLGSPLPDSIVVEEETDGGGIYTVKATALTAFGETLA